MNAIFKNLHLFILIYAAVMIYQKYDENQKTNLEMQEKQPQIQSQIQKERKEKQNLEKYFKDIQDAKERIELVAQKLEKLQRQLPEEVSDAENLNIVRNIAEAVNMKNIILSPGEDKIVDFYIAKDYRLRVTGTYLQILVFLEKLAKQERILNVKSVTMEREKGKQRGRFVLLDSELILETFRYNKNYKEDRGIQKIEESFNVQAPAKSPPKRERKVKRTNEEE
jgi:type IV pilus assembly protein PilO